MPNRSHPRPFLRLERLDARDTPANLQITYSTLSHTLQVVGDDAPNALTVQGNLIDPGHFILSSATDSINSGPGPYSSPLGIQNLVLRMRGGSDQVTFTGPDLSWVTFGGSVTIDGGDGTNTITAPNGLKVGRGLTIVNGFGPDMTTLTGLQVGGALTVRNGDGGSSLSILRNTQNNLSVNYVGRSVTITNGAGADYTSLEDLSVGGAVSVRNGAADGAGVGGFVQIFNLSSHANRSEIRGNVAVSFPEGSASGFLGDAEVGGNVTFAYGPAAAATTLDAVGTRLPTVIRGNLTITGAGLQTINLGTGVVGRGLTVGGRLAVASRSGSDAVTLFGVLVGGATGLALGDGNNIVKVDDSVFLGPVNMATGAGDDKFLVEGVAGTAAGTTFLGSVRLELGAGSEHTEFGLGADANAMVVVAGHWKVTGSVSWIYALGHISVLFGSNFYDSWF